MGKKFYVKPCINKVLLRIEERLASCSGFYLSSYDAGGCNTNQFQVTNPGACYFVTSDVAGS